MIRVLLVEDEDTVRRAIARALGARGWTVEQAGSLAEARALTTDGVFDCAILDIDLPDGTGVDLAKTLRHEARVRRFFFFSGASDLEVLAEASSFAVSVHKAEGIQCLLDVVVQEMRCPAESQSFVRGGYSEADSNSGGAARASIDARTGRAPR